MGHRIRLAIAALAVLATASCARPAEPTVPGSTVAKRADSTASGAAVGPSTTAAAPFRHANAGLAAVVTGFVRDVVVYDARHEAKLGFIARAVRISTAPERQRLTHSPRAQLPWSILRARGERTHLIVNGVTITGAGRGIRRVIVEATVSTDNSFARVSNFRQYTLTLGRIADSWLVSDADGPGL
jgi:hypothetical protein